MLGQAFAHCPIFPTAASRRSLDRLSVPMWPITLSGRLPIVGLVGFYPANCLMGRESIFCRISPLTPLPCGSVVLCGITVSFGTLSPCKSQVPHALLTRPPLEMNKASFIHPSFDLHVLSTPPAFVLSQDQTLVFNPLTCYWVSRSLSLSLQQTPQPQVKLISELTVVSLSFLYRFQDSRARFRLPFGPRLSSA